MYSRMTPYSSHCLGNLRNTTKESNPIVVCENKPGKPTRNNVFATKFNTCLRLPFPEKKMKGKRILLGFRKTNRKNQKRISWFQYYNSNLTRQILRQEMDVTF